MDNRISLAPFGEPTKRLRNFSGCLECSKARIVLVVEVAAIEGVGLSSNNGTVAVTLGPPTPGAVSIGPGKGRIKYNFASEILYGFFEDSFYSCCACKDVKIC